LREAYDFNKSDVHVYYFQQNKEQATYAKELWERIRRECAARFQVLLLFINHHSNVSFFLVPELRIYSFWDRPIGPHPVAMFEVNLFSPAQFGAFIPWLAIWRGPLSALVHPNTVEEGIESEIEMRNHSQRAIWMGEKLPLDFSPFYKHRG
jgi:aromatic ring-cleaving dioxygenase